MRAIDSYGLKAACRTTVTSNLDPVLTNGRDLSLIHTRPYLIANMNPKRSLFGSTA